MRCAATVARAPRRPRSAARRPADSAEGKPRHLLRLLHASAFSWSTDFSRICFQTSAELMEDGVRPPMVALVMFFSRMEYTMESEVV